MILKIKKNYFLILFNIFNILLFFNSFKNINSLNYLLFSLTSLAAINYTLFTWKYYSELFFNIFVYLGFWFKFSLNIAISINYRIPETNEFLSVLAIKNNYSDLLDTLSLAILTLLITFYLLKKIKFQIFENKSHFVLLNYCIKNLRFRFIFFNFLFFFLILFLNTHFGLAFLGQQEKIYFIEKLFKALLIIILPLLIALIADNYQKIYGLSLRSILVLIFCFFLLSITLNSRALIINILPVLIVYFCYLKNLKNIVLFIIITVFLFLFSFFLVHQNRVGYETFAKLMKSSSNSIIYLTQNRWVGISGMINVEYTKNKKLTTLKESLVDKNQDFNFYDRNFFYSQDKVQGNYIDKKNYFKENENRKFKNVFIPGFMAFFYYSGSIFVLITLNILLAALMIFSEKICSYFVYQNKLFLSLFSLILVWRIIHLGLFPLNSLIFYLVLLSTPILFFLIDKQIASFFLKNEK
jgi:hypothetical protein